MIFILMWSIHPYIVPHIISKFRGQEKFESEASLLAETPPKKKVKTLSKVKILPWICLFLIFFSSTTSAFILAPPMVNLSIPAGKTRGFILTVINEDETESSFRLYCTDIGKTNKGELQFPPPGTTPYSCADYIEMETTSFLLPPQGKKEIRCGVSLPANVSGSRYVMVMCELVSGETAQQGIVIAPRWRIGSLVQAIVMGTEKKKVELTDILHSPPSGKEGRKFTVVVANKGNIGLSGGDGYVSIMDKNKRVIQRLTLEAKKTIFPEGKEEISVFTKGPLPPGNFTAIAAINYQGTRSVSKIASFIVEENRSPEANTSNDQISVGIVVKPETIELEIPPGGVRTFGLSISNEEEFSFDLETEMKDIVYNERGEEICLDSGKTSYSLKDIAEVKPKELAIAPHGKKNVRILFTVPKGRAGALYGKLIIHGDSASKDYRVSGRKEVNIAVAISKTTKKAGKINKVEVIPQPGKGTDITLEFLNQGNVRLEPRGEVKIQEMGLNEVARALFKGVAVMPGEMVNMQASCPDLPPGRYKVMVTIDYGEKESRLFWSKEIQRTPIRDK